MKKKDEEVFRLTPWGCLSAVLSDYGIDTTHISGKVGGHIVDDFMDLMISCGHAEKCEGKT